MKPEKLCFYLLLFAFPFQIRKFIWAQNWPINEWTTIWLWGTDILIFGLFLFWLIRLFRQNKWKQLWNNHQVQIILSVYFWLIAGISLRNNLGYLSFYHWFKLTEIILFFLYLSDLVQQKWWREKNFVLILLISGLFQSVIAIGQFLTQSSLGLRFLGESVLTPNLPGVAKINLAGIKLIRAYGTFPHPSILAFFLLVVILFWLNYLIKNQLELKKYETIIFYPVLFLLSLALFLTFSRTTIILAIVLISFFLLWQKKFSFWLRQVFLWGVLVFSLWSAISAHFFHFSSYRQSINLRLAYQNIAQSIFINHYWFGIGWGNFVNYFLNHYLGWPSWAYQPVHNIYWLILSEMGILGFLIFSGGLWLIGKKILSWRLINPAKFLLGLCFLTAFLIIGLEDHFFLTTQQGWLMIGIIYGAILARPDF